MDSIHTTINKELINELFKTKRLISIITITVCSIGFVTWFILDIIFEFKNRVLSFAILFLFAFYVSIAIVYLVNVRKNTKEFDHKTIESDATFYDEYINIVSFNKDVQIEDVKHFYKELLFFKEKKNYVLVYLNRILAVPFTKRDGLVDYLISKGVKKK